MIRLLVDLFKILKMKKTFSLIAIATTIFLTSCSDDHNHLEGELNGENVVSIEFDSSFNGDDLVLGNTYTNSNNEKLTISRFDYIVSNFVLITEEGEEYMYPKEKSYFIVSEGGETTSGEKKEKTVKIQLKDIPAGRYTKIKFGLGVDQERYKEGKAVQEGFWEKSQEYGLTWSWQAGYIFVASEGSFTSETQSDKKPFWLHIASRGTTVDLYKEIELSMETALISGEHSPQIHIVVDANKMLDGATKVKLSDGETIMGGATADVIANNNTAMFTVHHVHNGNNHH